MKRVAVVFGGFTDEKIISERSASMVMDYIDRNRFVATLVRIDDRGWFAIEDDKDYLIDKNDFSYTSQTKTTFDLVFMMIHGTPGEDGLLQSYFDLINIPVTTGNTLNMALTANKGACTTTLREKGFRCANSVIHYQGKETDYLKTAEKVGLPCFVKPNKGGSSLATFKIEKAEDIEAAVEKAFAICNEVIVESFISGTEVTCGVIEKDGKAMALPVTEIIPENEFFDFAAKYEGKSSEVTPARISDAQTREVQKQAEEIYQILNCKGMIRVDFFVNGEEFWVIEVNTVPGFSAQSIIPQQAAVVGISKTELISLVIDSIL